jgi:hypothetical protein
VDRPLAREYLHRTGEQEKLERMERVLSRAAGPAGKHRDIGCDSITQLERISVFLGGAAIDSRPEEGTRLTVEVPLLNHERSLLKFAFDYSEYP